MSIAGLGTHAGVTHINAQATHLKILFISPQHSFSQGFLSPKPSPLEPLPTSSQASLCSRPKPI